VAISSRTQADLDETASQIETSLSYVCDATNEAEVEDMVGNIVSTWGGIDILINNVGGGQSSKGPLYSLSASDLSRLLDLNVVSMHITTSAVLNQCMLQQGKGKILNISSKAGKIGIPGMSHYVASKFAVEGLTATLAAELQDKGIQVNSISPGAVHTKSFPKPADQQGVRTAESVYDGLFCILESDKSGCYLHVNELDQARAAGLDDAVALKPINEPTFSC
jgi:short-subunit dehydrogenase